MMTFLVIAPAFLAALPQAPAAPTIGAFVEQTPRRAGTEFLARGTVGFVGAVRDLPAAARTEDGAGEVGGVALAPDGTLYVAWSGPDRIVRVRGRSDAIAFARRGAGAGELRRPGGIAFDARAPARLLVADTLNHRIAVFDPDGKPLGLFGARGSGAGELDHPADVAVDARGHAYVADLGNDRIVEFDEHGKHVGSFGGRGTHPGLFAAPSGIDVSGGRVFVADRDNHRVQVLGLDGEYAYEWGLHALTPRQGRGFLHHPDDVVVAADGKSAAVLEELEQHIQTFGPLAADAVAPSAERDSAAHYAGHLSVRGDVMAIAEPSGPAVVILDRTRATPIEITRFGRAGRGAGRMMRPSGVLLDAAGGLVYVADPLASRISAFRIDRAPDDALRYEPDLARLVRSVDLTSEALPLRATWTIEPQGMALGPDGRVLVADLANRRVVEFGADLSGPLRAIPVPLDPVGLAYDPRDGRILVTDPASRAFCVIAPDGAAERTIRASEGRPFGVAVAPDGTVWVGDRERGRLARLVDGALVPAIGAAPADGARVGRGELLAPEGLACDARGRVHVLEAGNHRFQVFERDGTYVDMFGARFYTEAGRVDAASREPRAWDGARSVATNAGSWRVSWRARPAVVPRGEAFAIDAWVFARGEPAQPVRDVELRADAWMPDHLHGMNRTPSVVRRDDGGFTFEGLLFHMSGRWELDFDVVQGAVAERAQTRVDLE